MVEQNLNALWWCRLAIATSAFVSLACFGFFGYIANRAPSSMMLMIRRTNFEHFPEILSLCVNIVVTLCMDGMGYVHAVSLRWALYAEGRLEFNTNLRLLTSAKESSPNSWLANAAWVVLLILSYVVTSTLVLSEYENWADGDEIVGEDAWINGIVILGLVSALLGQAILSLWCLRERRSLNYIKTWSLNPLINTLACLEVRYITYR